MRKYARLVLEFGNHRVVHNDNWERSSDGSDNRGNPFYTIEAESLDSLGDTKWDVVRSAGCGSIWYEVLAQFEHEVLTRLKVTQ
jgi:hypothetical protein